MVRLICVVLGIGSLISVDVELSDIVYELKLKIKERKPNAIYGDADNLKLYLAREGDKWLRGDEADIKAFKAGKFPARIKSLMQEDLLLEEDVPLGDDDYFGENFEPRVRDIHVLVELPDEPEQVNKYKRWIRRLFYGELALMVLNVAISPVIDYYGKGEERMNATGTSLTIVGGLVPFVIGIMEYRKRRIESKIPLAYRRWGYEPIP